MRILPCLALLAVAVPATAHADGFLDLVGGIQFPLGDDNWTNTVETSPKLGVRAGAIQNALGEMLSLDWTPENLDNNGGGFVVGSASAAGHRFRVLGHLLFQQHVGKITAEARAGVGADIAYGSYTVNVLGSTSSHSNTNVGFGFEVGAGLFFNVGSIEIGPEVALPISSHSHQKENAADIPFDYTSYDLDLLLAVRMHSH